MTDVLRTIIIPAAHVELARSLALALSPVGGRDMFVVELAPPFTPDPGKTQVENSRARRAYNPPATHYISSGPIDAQFDALLRNAAMLHGAAPLADLETIQALVAAADVTNLETDSVAATLKRLGLQLI